MLLKLSISALAILSAMVISMLALGTGINVVSRAVFTYPVPGVVDVGALGVVVAVFAALPEAEVEEAHVRMRLLTNVVSKRAAAAIRSISYLISSLILCFVIRACWIRALRSYESKEVLPTSLQVMIWPFRALIVLGFILLLIVFLRKLLISIKMVMVR